MLKVNIEEIKKLIKYELLPLYEYETHEYSKYLGSFEDLSDKLVAYNDEYIAKFLSVLRNIVYFSAELASNADRSAIRIFKIIEKTPKGEKVDLSTTHSILEDYIKTLSWFAIGHAARRNYKSGLVDFINKYKPSGGSITTDELNEQTDLESLMEIMPEDYKVFVNLLMAQITGNMVEQLNMIKAAKNMKYIPDFFSKSIDALTETGAYVDNIYQYVDRVFISIFKSIPRDKREERKRFEDAMKSIRDFIAIYKKHVGSSSAQSYIKSLSFHELVSAEGVKL